MPRVVAIAVLIITALGVTACGSSSCILLGLIAPRRRPRRPPAAARRRPRRRSAAAGTSSAVAVQADPSGQLKFNTTSLTAAAGTVHITFTNQAPEGHNLTLVKGSGSTVIAATPTFTGGSRTLTAKLAPGTYTYFCSVPGHRDGRHAGHADRQVTALRGPRRVRGLPGDERAAGPGLHRPPARRGAGARSTSGRAPTSPGWTYTAVRIVLTPVALLAVSDAGSRAGQRPRRRRP